MSAKKTGRDTARSRRANDVNFGALTTLTGFAIKQAQEHVFDTFMAATPDPNITPARFSALTIIANNPDLTQVDLARSLGIARSGAAAMLKVLQDLGYISQDAADGDKRTVRLVLRPAGRLALEAVTEAVREQDKQLTSALTPEERETFMSLLNRIRS